LSKAGAKYIFATHLHGLQEIPSVSGLSGLKVWHLRVRHDLATDRLIYDRTLHPGAGSSLYGLEVAKAMAIPFSVLETAHAIRKSLVGQKTDVEAPASNWNGAVHRRVCEICGASVGLEVHHIEQRATAVNGRLADGTSMNSVRNLVVVCEACHDKHHAKEIEIGPVQQTSDGPVRHVSLAKYAHKPAAGITEEQIDLIKSELRAHPNLTAKRMVFDLEARHGIKISPQRLAKIRASL
jgi:hypothetical protein